MIPLAVLDSLERELNAFDLHARRAALARLLELAQKGEIPLEPVAEVCNMHCHTFFSFNAYGHSPTSLAWLGKKKGFAYMGIVDFDVLDGVDEFLEAATLAGVKGSAGIETRIFLPEFSTREINSPGEPGVLYHMGIGFTSSTPPASARPILDDLRQRAIHRNRLVIERVNAFLDPVRIDYERDVLPLTPAGTATERHIVIAYIQAAARQVADPAAFWAEKLQIPLEQAEALLQEAGQPGPRLQNQIRAKLMKRGGVGYIQPAPETFPNLAEFHQLIQDCGALPTAAWLDGTSAGEQSLVELLDLLVGRGVVAFNVIPDRNWNIPDPKIRETKVQNLYQAVQLAREFDLPIHAGTEMNSFGQRMVDDFRAPELAPLVGDFLAGAQFVFGHTVLQRVLGAGFQSEWARAFLPERKERNAFYTQVGKILPPGDKGQAILGRLEPGMSPQAMIKKIRESEGVYV